MEFISTSKIFIKKYESYFSPLALFAGFIIDNLTLRRIDLWAENLLIIIYLFIALSCILILNLHEAKKWEKHFWLKFIEYLPLALQFVFGGLFSVFVVFYVRSASIFASWPFLGLLFGLLIGNEMFQKRYQRLVFQLTIFFITIFSYSVFALPIFVKKIGTSIFLLSGLFSLVIMVLVFGIIYLISKQRANEVRKRLLFSIGSVYLVFNLLYFSHLIPPIPLALQDGGIYHNLQRSGNNYQLTYETPAWYQFTQDYNSTIHWKKGERVYCFSAVFAPTEINTKIYHSWEFLNPETKKWETKSLLNYPISGGREKGYRGYSYKNNLIPGKWRVNIMIENKQILGRINFKIVEAIEEVEKETLIK